MAIVGMRQTPVVSRSMASGLPVGGDRPTQIAVGSGSGGPR